MSVLNYPSLRSPAVGLDELEDAFLRWVHDPDMPDVVDLGEQRVISMAALARQLEGSQTTLAASACRRIGVAPGASIARATAELLHATIDPDGPRCRSFRAASYYLRGLVRLDADLRPTSVYLDAAATGSGAHVDVR